MQGFLIGSAIIAALFVAFETWRRRRGDDLGRIRSRWLAPEAGHRDLARIAEYSHRSPEPEQSWTVDERTWMDLDLDSLFVALDATTSGAGQQVLYDILRRPVFDKAKLEMRQRISERLGRDRTLRENLQRALLSLHRVDALDIPALFQRELPPRPAIPYIYPILTLALVGSIVVSVFVPAALFVFIAIAVSNISLQLLHRKSVYSFVPTVVGVRALLSSASALARVHGEEVNHWTRQLTDLSMRLEALRRSTSWLALEVRQDNDLIATVYACLNMLLLVDVNALVFSIEEVRRRRSELATVFEIVGSIDAMIAIASFRARHETSVPVFVESPKQARFIAVRHPLVTECVPNDLVIDGRGILVTGSNMSGKTTFIRTIAINVILAQSIHAVLAKSYEAPLMRVKTSIGRSDDLLAGKSYYLAEVDQMAELVKASESREPHLFVVDEMFRGTNTRERVAAARAILHRLGEGPHIVLASTHDLELIDLLRMYEFHHFREMVEEETLTFDYKLRPGPSSTRNAIALLKLRGLPADVVAEAMETVAELELRSTR